MLRTLILLICAAMCNAALGTAAADVSDDPVPVWHRRFSVAFNETTKLLWSWHTDGKLYYDADQLVEMVQRDNGRGDRYCMSIHPFTDTPCTHLVVGGQRYLIFPDLQQCCRCCSEEAGCGILDPNWLANAEYTGQAMMQGQLADEWTIRGLQPNLFYATADDQAVPLELDQLPNDYIMFHPETFSKGPIPPSTFDLPAFGCDDRCPLTSVCTILKLQGMLRQAFKPQLLGGALQRLGGTRQKQRATPARA